MTKHNVSVWCVCVYALTHWAIWICYALTELFHLSVGVFVCLLVFLCLQFIFLNIEVEKFKDGQLITWRQEHINHL